jgi:transcriptional regulator with XRE-family HTH domain
MSADLVKLDAALAQPVLALRLKDAARAIGVSDRLLWQWEHDRKIPSVRINGTVLFSVDVLRTWLIEQSSKATAATAAEEGAVTR